MNEREQFEAVFSQPPFEFRLARYGEDAPWPGHYVDYQEQLTWEGWQARAALASAATASHGQAPAGTGHEKELEAALRERDDADDFIDTLLDEVLGADRPEWSSAYGWAEALIDVQERITALHTPAINKAWHQFQEAIGGAQSPAPVHPGQEGEREAFIRWYMEYLHTDEMLAAYVWDNEHIVPQTWRAARKQGGQHGDN